VEASQRISLIGLAAFCGLLLCPSVALATPSMPYSVFVLPLLYPLFKIASLEIAARVILRKGGDVEAAFFFFIQTGAIYVLAYILWKVNVFHHHGLLPLLAFVLVLWVVTDFLLLRFSLMRFSDEAHDYIKLISTVIVANVAPMFLVYLMTVAEKAVFSSWN
jgi:hypothetical protein